MTDSAAVLSALLHYVQHLEAVVASRDRVIASQAATITELQTHNHLIALERLPESIRELTDKLRPVLH